MKARSGVARKLVLLAPFVLVSSQGYAAEGGPVMFAAPLKKPWCDGQSFVRLRGDILTLEMKNGAVDFHPVQLIEASGNRFVYGMPNSQDFRWTIRHRGTHIELDGVGVVPTDAAQHKFNFHANFSPCPT